MSTSNAKLLTRSHTVYSAKKRAKQAQIQEVVFDEDARREYLTGFRKRNLLKKEAKQKNAKERERAEKLELRKQHRRELAERAAKNVREVESALGLLPGDGILNSAITTQKEENQEEEFEFEDEEQLAVVTVVEDFTADSLVHPAPQFPVAPITPDVPEPIISCPSLSRNRDARETNVSSSKTKPKLKVKSSRFHYETKAGRKAEKVKQRARNKEKSERVGNKKRRGPKR